MTAPALPTDADLLEAPAPEQKARGLVPRNGLWVFIGVFILVLFGFAFYDLVIKSPGNAASAATSPSALDQKLGPEPPASDIREIVAGQMAKAPASKASAPVGTRLDAPADAPVARGAPLVDNVIKDGKDSAAQERLAMGAESKIFAAEFGNDGTLGDSVKQVASAGQNAFEQLRREVAAPAKEAVAPDATAQIIKALMGGDAKAGVRSNPDEAWLKDLAQPVSAEAALAQKPVSRWIVFQGTRIPIVIREGVNSDLPGPVTAVSTYPVLDSIGQCATLIPAGSRFFGRYSSDIRPGQSRVLVAFNRMVLPDGRSVDLTGAQGVDSIGRAGVEGEVNNHWVKMFGYGLFVALIASNVKGGESVSVTQPGGLTSTGSIAGQVLADTATRVLNRQQNIPPTIEMDPGARMFITVARDMALTPVASNCK